MGLHAQHNRKTHSVAGRMPEAALGKKFTVHRHNRLNLIYEKDISLNWD